VVDLCVSVVYWACCGMCSLYGEYPLPCLCDWQFFVAFDPEVRDDRLWHDKYSLRTEMVPSFLSFEQAKKVVFNFVVAEQ